MKRKMRFLLLAALFVMGVMPLFSANENSDTVFVYKGRVIKVSDSIDQVKVKVFDANRPNDSVAYKQLYEGIFSDSKSYETWSVMESIGFSFPPFTKNRKELSRRTTRMEPHYAGFGLAFSNLTDGSRLFPYQPSKLISLKAAESTEWFINFIEHCYPIYRNRLGITTGLGMSWNTYRLSNNSHLAADAPNVTRVEPAASGETYIYSRLKVVHITLPILLEWQPGIIKGSYLSAGVVAGIKTYSSYRVKLINAAGDEIKRDMGRGLNTNPLSLDLMVQAGIGNIGFFGKYGLVDVFEFGKGPAVRTVSLGMMLHF